MSDSAPRGLSGFWQELTRRRVVRVAVLYIAVAWAVIEVADTVVPYVGLPDHVVTFIIILAALGLPLAVVLSWAYRITPETAEIEGLEGEAGPPRPTRMWRSLAVAALTVVVIATVILVARSVRRDGVPESPPNPSVIAILPFSVVGDAEYDDFGAGIVGLLGTKLDGAGALRTVDSRALLSFVQRTGQSSMDPESARLAALQFGAGFFVLGDVLQVGDRIEVNASLYPTEARAQAVITASSDGRSDELFSMVDDLAAELLAGMAGGPGSRVTRIAAVTTASLPALRAFLEGERLERLDPRTVPISNNPSVVFTALDALHPILREYLLSLASLRLGETARTALHADRVDAMKVPATAGSLPNDLARSLRAQLQRRSGDVAGALATLSGARMETWYGQTLASPFYAQVLERFLRAEILVELNREMEALDWYAHIAELSPFEAPYRAISHLRQAMIHERAGDLAEARTHAGQALAIWSHADPALAPLIQEARRIASVVPG